MILPSDRLAALPALAPQTRFLLALAAGALPQTYAANVAGLPETSAHRYRRKLVGAGLVASGGGWADRRVRLLRLTDDGQREAAAIVERLRSAVA